MNLRTLGFGCLDNANLNIPSTQAIGLKVRVQKGSKARIEDTFFSVFRIRSAPHEILVKTIEETITYLLIVEKFFTYFKELVFSFTHIDCGIRKLGAVIIYPVIVIRGDCVLNRI